MMRSSFNYRVLRERFSVFAALLLVAFVWTDVQAAEILLEPELHVTRPDGSAEVERSGFWTYRVGEAPVDEALQAPRVKRQILFLADLSGSMPRVRGAETAFAEVVGDVVRRASALLEPFVGSPDFEISFYYFGDLRRAGSGWEPWVRPMEGAQDLSVAGALEVLPNFIPLDLRAYADAEISAHTYVAASVHAAVRRELGIDADPRVAMEASMPPLAVFAFTDTGDAHLGGGESHAPGRNFDNAPYAAWLLRHEESLQLEYHYWDLANLRSEVLRPPSRPTYMASWGIGGRVDAVNVRGGPVELDRRLQVAPEIRLTRVLAAASEGTQLRCAAREDETVGNPTASTIAFVRSGAEAPFVLGNLTRYSLGRHTVHLNTRRLCDELVRVVPNAEILLPGAGDASAELGYIEFVEYPLYSYELRADGIRSETPIGPLGADWWHVYSAYERGFVVDGPSEAGLSSRIDWTLQVDRRVGEDFEPVEPSLGLATLRAGGSDAWSSTTGSGERVSIHVPAFAQSRVPILGRRLRAEDGVYRLQLCATVDVQTTPVDVYDLTLSCPDCEDGAAGAAPRQRCVTIPLELAPRPIHAGWWALLVCIVGFALRAAWNYLNHPPAAHGLTVRLQQDGIWRAPVTLVRPRHSPTTIWRRYRNRPDHLLVYPDGRARFVGALETARPSPARSRRKHNGSSTKDAPPVDAAAALGAAGSPVAHFRVEGSASGRSLARLTLLSASVDRVQVGTDELKSPHSTLSAPSANVGCGERLSLVVGGLRGEIYDKAAPSIT